MEGSRYFGGSDWIGSRDSSGGPDLIESRERNVVSDFFASGLLSDFDDCIFLDFVGFV